MSNADAAAYAAWKAARLAPATAAAPAAGPLYSAPLITCSVGYDRSQLREVPTVLGPEGCARILRERIAECDREHIAVLLLDTKHKPLGVHIVAVGSIDSCSADPRYVYRAALVTNAATVVLAHNHPSGDPTPSMADVTCTKRMIEAGVILGMELLDHIVIGDGDRYVSLRTNMPSLWDGVK